MEKKKTTSGVEFYLASSVSDLLAAADTLGKTATVVLVNVSLRLTEAPKNYPHGGVSEWYEVSDQSGSTVLYWPIMAYESETSGLTTEMRQCGQFFAPALELEKRYSAGIQIIRIIKKREPEAEKQGVRSWFAGLLPALAGTLR